MREIKLQAPKNEVDAIGELAEAISIPYAVTQGELKLKTSTPKAKAFLSKLFRSPIFSRSSCSLSSHNIRALLSHQPTESVTWPAGVPFLEIQQDFWQTSHLTASFMIRTAVSAGLLAYALMKDDTILAIGAMIFTPFSPLILGIAFGAVAHQKALVKQAALGLAASLVLTMASSAVVAELVGGPLLFNRFGRLSTNVLIAGITGLMAAVADADDVGRRQLLGLAMAYPFVKFPVWVGIAMALGFPDASTTLNRFAALAANALVMGLSAAAAYWVMGRHGELKDLPL